MRQARDKFKPGDKATVRGTGQTVTIETQIDASDGRRYTVREVEGWYYERSLTDAVDIEGKKGKRSP